MIITILPQAFVYNNNEKFISVLSAHAFYEMIDNHKNKFQTKPEYWELNTSFIQEGDCMNEYVCLFNQPL